MTEAQLKARLVALGMNASQAGSLAQEIRRKILPVALLASERIQQHRDAMNGLAGYEYDELSGLFKKIKKAVKKVAKPISKAAAIVAPVLPVAAVVAGGAALIARKKPKAIAAPAPIAEASASVASQAVATGQGPDVAALMQQMIATQGMNMVSQPASTLMQEVASNGIQPEAYAAASMPPPSAPAMPGWVTPVGIAAGGGLLLWLAMRGRR